MKRRHAVDYDNFPKWIPDGSVGYRGTDFSQFENFQRGYSPTTTAVRFSYQCLPEVVELGAS